MDENRITVPFLKWAGGKRWLISSSPQIFPNKYNRYVEPFLGSAAVFFYLKPPKAILSVIRLFRNFDFQPAKGLGTWLKHGFKVGKAVLAASGGDIQEPAEEIFELSNILYTMIGRNPLLALEEFGAKNADPQKLDTYLQRKFGDKFNLSEMHSIAMLLAFPETASDWAAAGVTFDALASRTDPSAPINSRPVQWQTRARTTTAAGIQSFDELLNRAVPFELIDELIKSGVPREKIDEAMEKEDSINELEKLRKQTP